MPDAMREFRSKTLRRRLSALLLGLAFLVVLGVPFLMKPEGVQAIVAEQKLVIVSPHAESIRHEFEQAFSRWTARNQGHATTIEWLNLGGTTDCVRDVRDEFGRSPA